MHIAEGVDTSLMIEDGDGKSILVKIRRAIKNMVARSGTWPLERAEPCI